MGRACAAVVLALLLAGCGTPTGRAEALPIHPARVGACYDVSEVPSAVALWELNRPPVACTAPHLLETFHVGIADGTDAPDVRALFARCSTAATEFLGADWVSGLIQLNVSVPKPATWAAGHRRFSCEAIELTTPTSLGRTPSSGAVRRTTGLRDALRGPAPLALRCLAVNGAVNEISELTPIGCDKPHEAEYAGSAAFPTGGWPRTEDIGFDRCEPVAFGYVGDTPANRRLWRYTYGVLGLSSQSGATALRCYVVTPIGRRVTGSVKGLGDAAPKWA